MEIQGAAVTREQRWHWGRVASGVVCLLLLGGVAVQPAVAGGATEAMKSTIDEVLTIIRDKELKQPGRAEERRQVPGVTLVVRPRLQAARGQQPRAAKL